MRQINCYIPIKLCITGRLSDAQLDQLGEAIVRTVTARIAFAEQTINQGQPVSGDWVIEQVQEPVDKSRLDSSGETYRIPFYDNSGTKPLPVKNPKSATQEKTSIELAYFENYDEVYAALKKFFPDPQPRGNTVFGVYGIWIPDQKPYLFFVTGLDITGSSTYGALSIVSGKIEQRKFVASKAPAAFVPGRRYRLEAKTGVKDGVPYEAILQEEPDGKPEPIFIPGSYLQGKVIRFGVAAETVEVIEVVATAVPPEPLVGDNTIFQGNRELAELYLVFLKRFADVNVNASQAQNGLTAEQLRRIVGNNIRARTVTGYFTQGWKEYRTAGFSDVLRFTILEETILNQWLYGNENVLRNQLAIRYNATEGLGIFYRVTSIKFYDENGQPILGLHGGYRDWGYRTFAPSEKAIAITDPAIQLLLQPLKNITVDESVLIYRAAKGYVDNKDLYWPAVRDGWDGWNAINEELRKQMPILIAFLTGHLVAKVLERSSNPLTVAIGLVIDGLLKAAGYFFNIAFFGGLLDLAVRCGLELSLVQRPQAGQNLDALSKLHVENAIRLMRQLLTQAIAAGLTAATFKTAKETAITLSTPSSGGTGLTPAPAIVGVGKPGSGSAAAAAAPPPGSLPGGPAFSPSFKREGEGESSESTKPAEQKETGKQQEKRLMAEDRLTRPVNDRNLFAWESKGRGTFRTFLNSLKNHIESLKKQGNNLIPSLNESPLNQNTQAFIKSRPALDKFWTERSTRLAQDLQQVQKQFSAAQGDKVRVKELNTRKAQLEALIGEMNNFEKGQVGEKQPDFVEFFLQRQRGVVTDITQSINDPLHNFKTQFYVEVIKAITGWSDVFGVEFNTVRDQQVVP